MKAWSETAPPGGKPSFLDEHYPVIQKLRAELLQHRDSLGLTPKALRKLTGVAGADAPQQKDLITSKLDQIAARVAGYDGQEVRVSQDAYQDPYSGIPFVDEAKAVSDALDEELKKAILEDMG